MIMMAHKYTYHGNLTVHLPSHGVTARGGDTETVYEVEKPIAHPDFREAKGGGSKKKPNDKQS